MEPVGIEHTALIFEQISRHQEHVAPRGGSVDYQSNILMLTIHSNRDGPSAVRSLLQARGETFASVMLSHHIEGLTGVEPAIRLGSRAPSMSTAHHSPLLARV